MRRVVVAAGNLALAVTASGCESGSDRLFGRTNRQMDAARTAAASKTGYNQCAAEFRSKRGTGGCRSTARVRASAVEVGSHLRTAARREGPA